MSNLAKTFAAIILIVVLAMMLFWSGNLLIWGDPFQACIGWNDDSVYSWWCTADLTAREDVNRDGHIDVLDVQIVVNAYLEE